MPSMASAKMRTSLPTKGRSCKRSSSAGNDEKRKQTKLNLHCIELSCSSVREIPLATELDMSFLAEDKGRVFGSLKRNYGFWESMGASEFILSVIREGYKIPFEEIPPSFQLRNNCSALRHQSFVSQEISSHLEDGFVREVEHPPDCIHPLSVAENGQKLRLVLDMSVANPYVKKSYFRIEDIKTLIPLLSKGGYSAYTCIRVKHHIQ